jgi:hypothetical protein
MSETQSKPNPFSDASDSVNPYSSPDAAGTPAPSNRLFIPALILLVVATLSALYTAMSMMMMLSPEGPFSGDDGAFLRSTIVITYSTSILCSIVCAAGAIAMIRYRPKWLAWTGAVVALVPLFGPCLGLSIPLGIWAILALRSSDVNARFPH